MATQMFVLRGSLHERYKMMIFFLGNLAMLILWQMLTGTFEVIPRGILPAPARIVEVLPKMHFQDELVRNALYSVKLNMLGLFEATFLAIPAGIIIGIFPGLRAFFQRHIEAARYVPMTAFTGLFMVWFGIHDNMKVQFLAFSIFFYLLPQVINRVDEVNEIYVNTMYTMGANKWQTIRHVFIPYVVSASFTDCRVMAAVSWSYIVVAEMVNAIGGGIGAMMYFSGRWGRIPEFYVCLFTIILIGYGLDFLFGQVDRTLFKFKYLGRGR